SRLSRRGQAMQHNAKIASSFKDGMLQRTRTTTRPSSLLRTVEQEKLRASNFCAPRQYGSAAQMFHKSKRASLPPLRGIQGLVGRGCVVTLTLCAAPCLYALSARGR